VLRKGKGKVASVHAIKSYMGGRYKEPLLTSEPCGSAWSTSLPGRLKPRKEPWYPSYRRIYGFQSRYGRISHNRARDVIIQKTTRLIFTTVKISHSVLLTEYCAGAKIKKNEMGGACGAYGGGERGAQGSGGET
jgi:hypothetical protein